MEEQKIYGEIYESPVGALTILAEKKGIRAIKFGEDEEVKSTGKANEMTRWAVKELEEYFQGKRKEFTVPCRPEGTDFQKRVWRRSPGSLMEKPGLQGDCCRSRKSQSQPCSGDGE